MSQNLQGGVLMHNRKGEGASSQACRWRSADVTLYIPEGGEDTQAN